MAFEGILLRYSGGATNVLRDSSLGGVRSNIRIGGYLSPQLASLNAPLAGVEICVAKGNPTGTGTLIWHHDTQELVWIPPGTVSTQSDAGPAPLLPQTLNMPKNAYPATRYTLKPEGSGFYQIGTATAWILVYLTVGSLPSSRTIVGVTVANTPDMIFDQVYYAENVSGDTEYRCIYLENAFSDPIWVKVSITSQPANCTISIGNEYAGVPLWPGVDVAEISRNGFVELIGPGLVLGVDGLQVDRELFELHVFGDSLGGGQVTNGLTGDVAYTIVDEGDSTSVLASTIFGSSVEPNDFIGIDPGNMVSLWFKRVKAPGAVSPTTDTFQFKIEYQTDEFTTPWA